MVKRMLITGNDKKTVQVTKMTLIAGYGIVGDVHSGAGARQVLICSEEAYLSLGKGEGICTSRFKPNIVINSFGAALPVVGTRFALGTAELEVTEHKRCFGDDCPLACSGGDCPLRRGAVFAAVISGGEVSC